MLLFTRPTLSGGPGSWAASATFDHAALVVEARLARGRHLVSVHSGDDRMSELVSSMALDPEDEAVSSFHLPPYYRWEEGPFSCRFTAEWRDGAASLAVSLRHLASLRSHPRARVVDADDGMPASAIVIGSPTEAAHLERDEPTQQFDWRGWHVVDIDDPFEGPTRRVLATHTQIF